MSTVYALIDPRDGLPHYVGATVRFRRRIQMHRNAARRMSEEPKYDVTKWQRGLVLSGLDFEARVLEEVSDDDLPVAEAFWIAQGRGLNWPLVNETRGGKGSPGFKHDHIAKLEMSAKARARPAPSGGRGRSWTNEERAKQAEARRHLLVPLVDDLGNWYESGKAAAAAIGVKPSAIWKHVGGRAKSVRGRRFRRATC